MEVSLYNTIDTVVPTESAEAAQRTTTEEPSSVSVVSVGDVTSMDPEYLEVMVK